MGHSFSNTSYFNGMPVLGFLDIVRGLREMDLKPLMTNKKPESSKINLLEIKSRFSENFNGIKSTVLFQYVLFPFQNLAA